jgi:hypothetical protein
MTKRQKLDNLKLEVEIKHYRKVFFLIMISQPGFMPLAQPIPHDVIPTTVIFLFR